MAESLLTRFVFTFHCACCQVVGCNFVPGICKLKRKKNLKTKKLKKLCFVLTKNRFFQFSGPTTQCSNWTGVSGLRMTFKNTAQ